MAKVGGKLKKSRDGGIRNQKLAVGFLFTRECAVNRCANEYVIVDSIFVRCILIMISTLVRCCPKYFRGVVSD